MAQEGIVFYDYDKISDTIMWINKKVNLKFCVNLKYRSSTGNYIPFHSEYKSYIATSDREYLSINLSQNSYFLINCIGSLENSIILRANDIFVLKTLYNKTIYPWFVGNDRIFSYNRNNKLIISGQFQTDIQLPTSDNKYIGFLPIVNTYENGDQKEGLRLIINKSDNFVDISIDKMFELFYYLFNTDIVSTTIGLLNYVKTAPYGENLRETGQRKPIQRNTFFDKL